MLMMLAVGATGYAPAPELAVMKSRYSAIDPVISVSAVNGETLAEYKPTEIDFRNPALSPNITSQLTRGLRDNANLRGLGAQFRPLENIVNSVPSWGATFGGSDMNKIGFQSADDLGIALEFIFEPGTCFVPDNKDYQVMMYSDQTVSFTAQYANLFASTSPFGQGKASLKTMCLNMAKKEPAGHVKYYPAVLKDKVLPKLAKIVADSSRRGPWDQARVWIYTDKASLKDIHDRLAPPIAPGYYVRGLRDVNKSGGFEEKDLKNAKLFDPVLIFAPSGDEDATTFLLKNILANHSRALKSALEKLDAARGLVHEAVSALSTIDDFALQRKELRKVHDNIKDSWYAIAAHRLRQAEGETNNEELSKSCP